MMKIESYQQLKEQKKLTLSRLQQLEGLISNDIELLRKEWSPLSIATKALKRYWNGGNKGIINYYIDGAVNILVKKILFRKTNFITRSIISVVTKNILKFLAFKNSDKMLHWLLSLLERGRDNSKLNAEQWDEPSTGVKLN